MRYVVVKDDPGMARKFTKFHDTLNDAILEAERLCRLERMPFMVLKVVQTVNIINPIPPISWAKEPEFEGP